MLEKFLNSEDFLKITLPNVKQNDKEQQRKVKELWSEGDKLRTSYIVDDPMNIEPELAKKLIERITGETRLIVIPDGK